MKKVNSDSVEPSTILTRTIEKFIANNTAINLLEFLADAMQWFHGTEFEKQKDDHHYTCLLIVRHILKPWLLGGPDVVPNVTAGFVEIEQITGEEEGYNRYRDAIGAILAVLGEQGNLGIADTDVLGFKSLADLSNAFELYNEVNKTKHPKAA